MLYHTISHINQTTRDKIMNAFVVDDTDRIEWLAKHFRDLAFNRDSAAIDEYVNDCSKSGVKPELSGADVREWLDEICTRRLEVGEFYRGVNILNNSWDLMTDYVEYLLSEWS